MATTRDSHNLRAVLAVRGFRRLLGVRLSSQLADGLFQAALAGSVLFNPDKQTSAMAIAAGSALLVTPYSLIGPFVGVFLDRWSRRQLVVITNLIRALLVLPAAALIHAGDNGVAFVVVAFAIIGLNRFLLSGLSAGVPHVVEDRRLVTANSLASTLGTICFSAGLGIAVLLVNSTVSAGNSGYAVMALLAPLGWVFSSLLARRSFEVDDLGPDHTLKTPASMSSALAATVRGMADGLSHLAARRGAAYAMAAKAGFRVLFGVMTLALLLLYRNYFVTDDNVHDSITGLVFVVGAGSAGVFVAALVTPPITRRIGGWAWIATLLVGVAIALPIFAVPFTQPLLVVAVFCINIAAQGTKIVVDTSIQHECDDDYRGRVFAVNDTTYNLSYVVGLFLAALTLPGDGHSPTAVFVVAAGYAVVAGWYALVGGRWARREGDDIAQPEPTPVPTPVG
ncbi:MFS transporter [Phytohabitans rumicis]|uniref:MFS transporter n=1 Tax=Phytohabitans rumicis TaxID=1076125 RepID=UPI0031E91795